VHTTRTGSLRNRTDGSEESAGRRVPADGGRTADERPGDRVLFVPQRFRLFVAVYRQPYKQLIDLTRAAD